MRQRWIIGLPILLVLWGLLIYGVGSAMYASYRCEQGIDLCFSYLQPQAYFALGLLPATLIVALTLFWFWNYFEPIFDRFARLLNAILERW